MADTKSISEIKVGDVKYPIDAKAVGGKTIEQIGELVTSISSSSTDEQYPSAKCIHDIIYGPTES
jgi:hypothetical protein